LLLLEKVNSPYVIKVFEFIQTKQSLLLVQEYANGGSLQNLLDLKGRLPEKIAKKFLIQIIKGCTALYAERVVHRDLKLDNILVHFPRFSDQVKKKQIMAMDLTNEEFTIKICDLGFSRQIGEGDLAFSNLGSPLQMAPEFYFSRDGYDHKVDVWALGALYYTMLTNTHAFNARDHKHLEERLRDGSWSWPKDVMFSLQGLEFLQHTFQFDPERRLNWN